MSTNTDRRPHTVMTYTLMALMLVTALAGTFHPAIYADFARPQRVAESQGQDLVTLLVALPLLALALRWTKRDDSRGPIAWVGTLGYALYVYLIYAYGGVYNLFFPAYVAIVGLSIFSTIGVMNGIRAGDIPPPAKEKMPRKFIALYFFSTALLLALVWGSAVITAIVAKTPDEATIVYVTDLAFVLPVFTLAGVWFWQRKAWGLVLAGVMLVKAVALGLSICAGQTLAYVQGVGGELSLALFFGLFTVVGIVATGFYLKHLD